LVSFVNQIYNKTDIRVFLLLWLLTPTEKYHDAKTLSIIMLTALLTIFLVVNTEPVDLISWLHRVGI